MSEHGIHQEFFDEIHADQGSPKAEAKGAADGGWLCLGLGKGFEACIRVVGAFEAYEAKLNFLGRTIYRFKLTREHPSITWKADIGIAKGELQFSADFKAKSVTLKGEVCVRDFLWKWKCLKVSKTFRF